MRAVIPCHNRSRDAELLLNDLAAVARVESTVNLRVIVVDNASDEPLSALPAPDGLRVEHLRLESNTGGSGGFNAGIEHVLSAGIPADARELIWLLDSDARVEPGTLRPLLRALEEDDHVVAVGSALADERGEVFEVGGRVDRRTGEWSPAATRPPEGGGTIAVDYAAACSLLVRRWAVERAGLLPDLFVAGDDVAWCLRLARATGGVVAVAPRSVARHPRYDRMRTWSRYYSARNTFAAMAALGLGADARWRRATREVGRALAQTLVGRDDLAELHLAGLRDAAEGNATGPGPATAHERFRPLDELGPALRDLLAGVRVRRVILGRHLGVDPAPIVAQLRRLALDPTIPPPRATGAWSAGEVRGGLWRVLRGPRADVAVVSARARPEDWLAGKVVVTVCPEGFAVRRVTRRGRWARAAAVLGRGLMLSARLARRGPAPAGAVLRGQHARRRADPLALSVVVVCHDRRDKLERTLSELSAGLAGRPGAPDVIVVDNASTDGTPDLVADRFPSVRLARLEENLGVAAYNVGVGLARGDAVLVLDDDSWPEPGAVDAALALLASRPDLAAVALHPRHPETDASEWPFAERAGPTDRWPLMGCGNIVRREAWLRVGGYEPAFFLYRNDTDLALKILAAGMGVHFNPAWVVRHDSPSTSRKPARWFSLATRNWVWMCRRHGRGWTRVTGVLAGWASAHRTAGMRVGAHARVLAGVTAGLLRRPPALPEPCRPGSLRRLLRERLG